MLELHNRIDSKALRDEKSREESRDKSRLTKAQENARRHDSESRATECDIHALMA